jgi:Rod binding domain-containing protein
MAGILANHAQLPPIPKAMPQNAKAWATAVDFEAQFLKTMLEEAYSGLTGEGPLGGEGTGAEAWRSFLIDEQAKGMAGRSGLGIAEAVYRDTLKRIGQ